MKAGRAVIIAAALGLIAVSASAAEAPTTLSPGAPLTREGAVGAMLAGGFLLLFGKKLYRMGVVFFFASLSGMVASFIASVIGQSENATLFGFLGAAAGAILALPLEFIIRMIVGGIAGMVVTPVIVAAFTDSVVAILTAAACGLALGSGLSYLFRRMMLIAGFSMVGAVMLFAGIASYNSPDGQIELGGGYILGIMLVSAFGISFQYRLESPEEPEPEDKKDKDGDD